MRTHEMRQIIKLAELLRDIALVGEQANRGINGISIDSRSVEPGNLFIAMPGVNSDGRKFVDDAISRGAAALLLEQTGLEELPETSLPVFSVKNVRQYVGLILNRFYDYPSSKLKVIGITGTNGKTTCTQLLSRIIDKPDQRCAVIGTLGSGYPGELNQGMHTTPDVVSMHRLLASFVADGAGYVCMEVSSHALEQERVAGVAFDIAVFTNLTRDHLDYHGDMESYAAAKTRLFSVDDLQYAVINLDDEYGRQLAESVSGVEVIGFGLTNGDVRGENLHAEHNGMRLTLVSGEERFEVSSNLFGEFNVSNLLAVAGVLKSLGWPLVQIAEALSGLQPVAGRMERFGGEAGRPVVIVDYAHTPDALKQALTALRPHVRGVLWCVFGCGGDRDRGKRPLMGAVADEMADHVVLTDDNPRNEKPDQIISEIEQGIKKPHQVIQPREQAVRSTINQAEADDLVLLAGKGHEEYQEIDGHRFEYSDRQLVQEVLGEVA